jgi:dipeptidase E
VELLLLSSSRTPAGYLTDYLPEIRSFAAGIRRAAFIPFAAVRFSWDEYVRRVEQATGFDLHIAHAPSDLETAELVIVGGGNTFQLLKECRDRRLLEVIRARVASGCRYLGWSAGAVLSCPTIRTTNDMPICQPASLDALRLIPFQINLHYVDRDPASTFMGETREERIGEFLEENPCPVLALYEGSWLRVSQGAATVTGPSRLFQRSSVEAFDDGVDISHLLDLTPRFDRGRRPYEPSDR